MDELANSGGLAPDGPGRAGISSATFKPPGVRGWLLVLCLMLTAIGPLIAIWLMADEYTVAAPHFAQAPGLQASVFVAVALTACSVAFGIHAGAGLWLIRPGAVGTAKKALLLGLAVDVITTVLDLALGPASSLERLANSDLIVSLVPSLVFFTACFAYLNKSARVAATYSP